MKSDLIYYLALDQYFGNVCELDVIFNFERVHTIIDELLMAGHIQETSLKEVKRVSVFNRDFELIILQFLNLFKSVENGDTIQENELNQDGTETILESSISYVAKYLDI